MSSLSVIAIKGNYLDKVRDIIKPFRYIDLNKDKTFDSWDKSLTYLGSNYFDYANNNIALRGLWFANGWTIISDPEMVDASDTNAMENLSTSLGTIVLSFLIQTTSGSFEFAKYDSTMQRHFFSTGGQVAENNGAPMNEENGLNINDKIFADDIVKLADKFGIDLEFQKSNPNIIVKEFGYNEEMQAELNQFASQNQKQEEKKSKPWWKFGK